MCGITGIIGRQFNHTYLDEMMARIAHRGPDGQGRWQNGPVSLGHLRLSIIDLSDRASQPMKCYQTGNILVFNGEIYNYKELKEVLAVGYDFRSDSDTEVILAAFQKWGPDFLKHLRGMFTIAMYDNSLQKVLLARDRLGIKPLYYRNAPGYCLFSSEIKGLVNIPGLPQSVNDTKVVSFLNFRHLDTDNHTFFNEVRQVPSATFCWVDANGKMGDFVPYWRLPISGEHDFNESKIPEFQEKFSEAIRLHLRSDVPVGSFLSGGLDSSSIACVAYDLLQPEPMETFSSIMAEKTEENALIPLLQNRLSGGKHNELHLTGAGFIDELPEIIYHHDEPLPDASMYAHYQLCKMAKQRGIKVLLSGNGGDEVLGGYACHIYALLGRNLVKGNWTSVIKNIRSYASNRHESPIHLAMRALQESSPFSIRNARKKMDASGNLGLLNSDITVDDIDFYPNRNKDPWQANYENNMNAWTIPPFLHYEDRNSMAFGVEIRVPMLDHEFVEYMAGFSPESLVRGRSKNILRQSLQGIVPQEVLDQKGKYGFPAPLELYTRYDRKAFLNSYLANIEGVPFLNLEKSAQLVREYIENNQVQKLNECWRIYSMSVWYHKFFD